MYIYTHVYIYIYIYTYSMDAHSQRAVQPIATVIGHRYAMPTCVIQRDMTVKYRATSNKFSSRVRSAPKLIVNCNAHMEVNVKLILTITHQTMVSFFSRFFMGLPVGCNSHVLGFFMCTDPMAHNDTTW